MQWLINIILEAVAALGYLTTSFVDRGDPADWDFEEGDLTKDAAWHDLDLSGIVPSNARGVLLGGYCTANVAAAWFQIRTKGNALTFNIVNFRTQLANTTNSLDGVCPIGSDGILEYRLSNVAWLHARIVVKGWWL